MVLEPVTVGDVQIAVPTTIASGVITTTPSIIKRIARETDIGFLTTKSFNLEGRLGNLEPIITQPDLDSVGNAVGLTNPGIKIAAIELQEILPLYQNKPLIISIFGSSLEEFVEVAKIVNAFDYEQIIVELNLSCPHVHGTGAAIGVDPHLVYKYTKAVRDVIEVSVMPKLTPNVQDIKPLAQACLDAGADAITAINTVGPFEYKTEEGHTILTNGLGGKSGLKIYDIAKRCVRDIYDVVGDQIPINACGGIGTASQVREITNLGASMVGFGSELLHLNSGPTTNNLNLFFSQLSMDLITGKNNITQLYNRKWNMNYMDFKVTKIDRSEDLALIKLDRGVKAWPGQFIYTWLPSEERNKGEKPFSIADDNPLTILLQKHPTREDGSIPHSQHLYELEVGDSVKVRGPYGNYFNLFRQIQISQPYLVGGGTGVAPLYFLAKKIQFHPKPVIFYGAAKQSDLLLKDQLKPYAQQMFISTDDGSLGFQGFITTLLETKLDKWYNILDDKRKLPVSAYVCGPEIMEAATVSVLNKYTKSDLIQVSIERMMKCGVGLCGSCDFDGLRSCIEGPVYSANALLCNSDFERFHRNKYGARVKIS